MGNSNLWQYIAVCIIMAGAIAWIVYRLCSKKHRNKSCCGCSLSERCNYRDTDQNEYCADKVHHDGKNAAKAGDDIHPVSMDKGCCHCHD